jgi:hypothetical protein
LTNSRPPGRRDKKKLFGERLPRTRSVASYFTSAGAEAIRLAATAGLVLDGWQADFLRDSLAETQDGLWAFFECGLIVSRQNGKGSVLEARVLAGMMLFGEKLILWSAHETKTATEAFLRCVTLFEGDPELRKQIKHIHRANGEQGIELRNGSRLRFVARTKGSGRGFTADLIILDEAYALTPEQMSALIPTLSSRPNPQIWYTSSPPLDGLSGAHLFALRRRALARDENLCWYDYGLAGTSLDELEVVDLGSEENWRLTNPAMGHRISLEFIRREFATMPPEDFARERLGIWPRQVTSGAGVIDPKLWEELADPDARPMDVAFAVDINPARTHAAIVAVGARPSDDDDRFQIAVIDYRPGTDWVPARLAALKQQWNPVAIGLDVKGPGGSLLLDLEKQGIKPSENFDEPARGDLAVPTAPQVAQGFGLFVDAVRQRQLLHSNDLVLNQALAGATTRALSGGSAWDRGKGGADISPLVAATVAYWAFISRKHLLTDPNYDLMASFY